MSRVSKFLLLFVLIVFALACNFVPQQVKDVQNLAGTAEAIASALPMETLQALPSALPLETIQAALPTELPNLEEFNYFNPQGEPLSEWNEIPIMPQATTGQEFNDGTYSFIVSATVEEVKEYYSAELTNRGWTSTLELPIEGSGGIMLYSQNDNFLTVTITSLDGEIIVMLTLG